MKVELRSLSCKLACFLLSEDAFLLPQFNLFPGVPISVMNEGRENVFQHNLIVTSAFHCFQ